MSLYSTLLDRMRKSLPTRTELKILRRVFYWNTLKAIRQYGENEHIVDYSFCSTREVPATQLPIETIVASVAKGDPALDLQTVKIFVVVTVEPRHQPQLSLYKPSTIIQLRLNSPPYLTVPGYKALLFA